MIRRHPKKAKSAALLQHSTTPTPRGFTLIELLVVATIIAVLAAMLLPVLGRAKEASRLSVCQNNLRQMGYAIHMYLNDYNEEFPPLSITDNAGTFYFAAWLGWVGNAALPGSSGYDLITAKQRYLNVYLGGPYKAADKVPVSRCPGDEKFDPATMLLTRSFYLAYGTSYSFSKYMIGSQLPSTVWPGIKLSQVHSPGKMVAMAEMGAIYYSYGLLQPFPGFQFHPLSSKYCLLFVDGHVAFQTVQPPPTLTTSEYTFDPNAN